MHFSRNLLWINRYLSIGCLLPSIPVLEQQPGSILADYDEMERMAASALTAIPVFSKMTGCERVYDFLLRLPFLVRVAA